MTTVQPTLRPPELQLEGCIVRIKIKCKSGAVLEEVSRVVGVSGPYKRDDWDKPCWNLALRRIKPEWMASTPDWIEVFVENGRIFAYPWRDEIVVIERPAEQQLSMF